MQIKMFVDVSNMPSHAAKDFAEDVCHTAHRPFPRLRTIDEAVKTVFAADGCRVDERLDDVTKNAVACVPVGCYTYYIFGELTDETLLSLFDETMDRAGRYGARFLGKGES